LILDLEIWRLLGPWSARRFLGSRFELIGEAKDVLTRAAAGHERAEIAILGLDLPVAASAVHASCFRERLLRSPIA
jgi:hypothetical protein